MKNILFVLLVLNLCCGTTLFAQAQNAKSTGVKRHTDKESLSFSKKFTGETLESTKKISISANFMELNIFIEGKVRSGKIVITLIKPDNEKLKTLEIDATSDVSYTQEFDLVNYPEFIGDWQVKIQTEKADGSYNMFISSKNIGNYKNDSK